MFRPQLEWKKSMRPPLSKGTVQPLEGRWNVGGERCPLPLPVIPPSHHTNSPASGAGTVVPAIFGPQLVPAKVHMGENADYIESLG